MHDICEGPSFLCHMMCKVWALNCKIIKDIHDSLYGKM